MLLNDPLRRKLTDAFNAGAPIHQIAKDLRMSHHTVRKWIYHYGLQREPLMVQPVGKTLPQKAIDFIANHYGLPGWSAAKIAEHLGLTRNTVIGRANRMGLAASVGPRSKRIKMHNLPDYPPARACQWINGDVTAAGDFHYCGAPVAAGSYCHDHAVKAYPLYRKDCELTMEEAS